MSFRVREKRTFGVFSLMKVSDRPSELWADRKVTTGDEGLFFSVSNSDAVPVKPALRGF